MSEHTKEPWYFEKEFVAHYDIKHDHGAQQIEVIGNTITKKNAERIVACVNACRGLSTKDLEEGGLICAVGHQLMNADKECAELTKQRDELLAIINKKDSALNIALISNMELSTPRNIVIAALSLKPSWSE